MPKLPEVNANVPQIGNPIPDLQALAQVVQALKQGLDSLAGFRGGLLDRAVTFEDLINLGLVPSLTARSDNAVVQYATIERISSGDTGAIEALSGTGIAVRTGTDAWALRSLVAPAAGIAISNANGASGDPTFALGNDLAALEGLGSTGLAVRTGTDAWAQRSLVAPAAGFTITNNDGASGNPTFVLGDDLAALEAMSGTGLVARTASNTYAQRTITPPAAGISVSNGDGVAGNPTLALANDLAAVEGLAGTGLAIRTGASTWTNRSITGTANRVTVTDGDGVAGNPTLDIHASYVGQASITTLGTIATGVWNGTVINEAYGGTGESTYTNGQLLIGNTVTGGLDKATLTAGTNITITNGAGTITIDASGGSGSPGGASLSIQYNNAGAFAGLGPLTNGQLVVGSTGVAPVAAALTAGASIAITNGAGSITVAQIAPATGQTSMVNPTGTTSTTGVMAGLAGAITPAKSGNIIIFAWGAMANNTASRGAFAQIRYGTGAAPANGVALTGTYPGFFAFHDVAAANLTVPFCLMVIVTGLSVGTAYWLDLGQGARTSGTANLFGVSIGAFEL